MSEGERLNFYRLSLLIMDGGTPTLKWLFEKQIAASGDLETFLKSRTTVLDGLRQRKIINLRQMDLLRPSTGIKPSVENFDTSLLITLLTSICSIQQPHCGWTVSPAASDLCPGADILRVRDARNNLFHHAKCGISDAEFQLKSSNVSDAISRLSNQLDQQQKENIQKIINDARNAARDFGRENEICKLIFLDKIDEIHHLVQGIYDRGNDGAITGSAVSEASHSLLKDEKHDGTKDQPDIDTCFTLGENSIIIVVKLYADLKKELTREIVMSIAKVLFKEENSTDVLEEIKNSSSRRLCIDSLLKRVIHREAATVQSFLMEIKSKCPAMANLLAKTIITEEDCNKFQLIDDRDQTNGRISSRVHTQCRIDESDVEFFQRRLYYSPENVDKIADVLLSKFYMSFSDHSKVTLHSYVFTRIHVLFEIIRSCHLDSVSELESALGSKLYKKWIEFRNETSGPNGENTGIWQSMIQRICGSAASLMESICQTFHIDFIRSERGSLVLIFKAGNNFSIELLKPESVKKKVRELLEKTCPEHHPLFKDPIHVTIFIKSAKYGEKEEIHFFLETIKDRKEIEDGHSHFGRHERDYMIEEMDPTPLKQWMFERLNIDECTKIHLEAIISWNDIGRGEKMKILLDTLERFEDGYELLQRYCEENDKFVYDRVFQKARQQSRTDHKTEFGYDKGEGMQKLFSTWIDFSEDPTVVQGKIEVSQKGILKAVFDQTEPVFIHKKLAELAKSVGIIKTPCGFGTGFRVGPSYIMTARHVVEPIMRKVPFLEQQQPQLLEQHQLSDTNLFIDFCYEWNSLASDPNHLFYFEPEIEYESACLDTVILKLKADNRVYPPSLTEFADVTQRLSLNKSPGYFIGHSQAAIKKTYKYQHTTLTQLDIYNAKKWSMDIVNENGYEEIENQHRVLFHCSFEKGASGSPGFWINLSNGHAYVELMLLHGFPTWYYDKCQGSEIPKDFFAEQGVSIKSVYDDVKAKDEQLCKTVFGTY